MTIHNYDSGRQPTGEQWTTEEAREAFEFIGFAAPFVVVVRKSDGVKGMLEFTHRPRVYFDFQPV
jgi:hypothetical protein